MNGAESLLQTLAGAGAEVCFANPGTTEMPLVAALDASPHVRAILGLFEGVCTGAADGYARMSGRPALTLLHLGPGFANGIANLHNARRAGSPVVNLIGDQATWHQAADAPLSSDIASLARPVGWVEEVRSAADLAKAGARAWQACFGPPGRPASLVVPADCQWEDAAGPAGAPLLPPRPGPAAEATAGAARALQGGKRSFLLLGANALGKQGLTAARRIADRSGCSVLVETFAARIERGRDLPDFPRLPYFPEQASQNLAGARVVVLAGAVDPVAFFGYPGQSSRLVATGTAVLPLASPGEDAAAALEAVALELGARASAPAPDPPRPLPATGALGVRALGQTLAALQPDHAIVVDEAATSGLAYHAFASGAGPHSLLQLTGGAIGQGLPCAVGAAVACPDRKVIAFQADGSGLYTLQSLWTMAREGLDVVIVICANRAYRILQAELGRAGVAAPGPKAQALTSLANPDIDWVALARGFGVPASRTDTAEGFAEALRRALAAAGPSLIEARIG